MDVRPGRPLSRIGRHTVPTLPPPRPPPDYGRVGAEYLTGLRGIPTLTRSRCLLRAERPCAFLAYECADGAATAEWFAFMVDDIRDLDSPRWLRREEVWAYLRFARTDGGNPARVYTRAEFASADAAYTVTVVRWRPEPGSTVELCRTVKTMTRRAREEL